MWRKLPLPEIAVAAWIIVVLVLMLIPSIGKVRPEPFTPAQQNGLRAAFLLGLATFPFAVLATVAWLVRALTAWYRRRRTGGDRSSADQGG